MLLEDRQAAEIEMLREKVRQLESLLAPVDFALPVEWMLTQKEASIFAYLLTRRIASKAQIMDVLYSDRPGDPPDIKIVDVFVCKLRKKVRKYGVVIETFWGQGYGIADREKWLPAGHREAA